MNPRDTRVGFKPWSRVAARKQKMALKLTMTCGPYDRARALIDGTVKPEGIELDVHVNPDNPGRRSEGPSGPFDAVTNGWSGSGFIKPRCGTERFGRKSEPWRVRISTFGVLKRPDLRSISSSNTRFIRA